MPENKLIEAEEPLYLSIKELFTSDLYEIPIYQRNYAWDEKEIIQLLQDIIDCCAEEKKTKIKKEYYLGNLIIYKNNEIFETIDGQQRLTTLTILLNLIKNKYPNIDLSWYKKLNLRFDCRIRSTNTLNYLYNCDNLEDKECNAEIKQGYQIIKRNISNLLKKQGLVIAEFCSYLFERVFILRIFVPYDTDKNQYFEIMNSRGEQLEKSEILKAQMLKILDENEIYTFNLIWESCSNMEKYVQYGFNKNDQRELIFDQNWDNFICKEFSDINKILQNTKKELETDESIKDILSSPVNHYQILYDANKKQTFETGSRYSSIINFSNFLLHVLRIQTKEDIPLDDKRLLDIFKKYLDDDTAKHNFVRQFGYSLLKCKFLYDKYIIKRDYGRDHWSLHRLKYENKNESYVNTFNENENDNKGINREILMLLAMFHVTTPSLVYKHWLNGALKYIYYEEKIEAEKYKKYLENLAKAFLFDRFLAKDEIDYYPIIYQNNGVPKENPITDESKLNYESNVENFVFNYLDYLLWQDYKNEKKYFKIEGKDFVDPRIENFEFTFRSSVEHYYPQHPYPNPDDKMEDEYWLHDFGNLCLISSSKNSRLSNYMPNTKKDYYIGSNPEIEKKLTIDSIKQRIMMEYPVWNINVNGENVIKTHSEKMIEALGLVRR
ncbi:MAG: DUF262 domain-containing HNH endonuclease family protein [Treponema sp.]|nr:DUF262 domain-containing HNH endonuclease family protein [Treponema sp.]MCL2250631.1 DUF262 domain-containing HNH endonuclease family protein [Treponema sp.]